MQDDLADARLVALLPGYAAPPAPVYALTPPSGHVGAPVRVLVDHLARALPSRLRRSGARTA